MPRNRCESLPLAIGKDAPGTLPFPRDIPYPFRVMLSICSDLDETPDEAVYLETIRFLNGTKTTTMGPGLGLEVGNTMYFDMPEKHFSYWSAGEEGRERVRVLMRSGHIDCLHSFGDMATSRAHAERALEEMERHGCKLRVWVDHGVAPSNFGSDIMRGAGDVPGSASYHADLTFAYGVRYAWMGRVTSVVGQDVPRRLKNIFVPAHPLASGKTLVKEGVKGLLAETVGGRYAMHAGNNLLRDVTLRDGRSALEFIRCNPHFGGVSSRDTAEGLGGVLTPNVLDLLEERGGVCILYTHLGKVRDRERPLRGETAVALRNLAERVREGRILLTTTRRLLEYTSARRTHGFRVTREGDWALVFVEGPDGEMSTGREAGVPDGLTFYAEDPEKTRLFFNGLEVLNLHRNPPDWTGSRSVSVPWVPLRMPEV
ncbi:MAG: hypothetical protein ACXW4G_10195 [Candidatus Deferrimicrobiaceae bacterium]